MPKSADSSGFPAFGVNLAATAEGSGERREPCSQPHQRHIPTKIPGDIPMSFQRIRSFLRAALLPTLAAASMAAHAGPFTGIFIFGDSLSDTGNVSIATDGVAPGTGDIPGIVQPYAPGRYSNGPLWVETFASGLGLAVAPALAGGNNFAFAGARTGFSGLNEPAGVLTQVAGLWGRGMPINPTRADPNALYVVVAGGNDMRDARSLATAGEREAAALAAVNNLKQTIGYLAASGARNVLISTLPDLGATPEALFLGNQTASTEVSNLFNTLVKGLLGLEQIYATLNIELLDMAAVAVDVRKRPLDFGVTNTGLPCNGFAGSGPLAPNGTFVGASCDSSLFSDALHPSALAHRLIGEAALAVYGVPVPGTLALMALALLLLAAVQRNRTGRGRMAVAVLRPAAP
ncbi:MAG: SGNH/GDSL hydrolase family protein [Hydrogenophaga sp.]